MVAKQLAGSLEAQARSPWAASAVNTLPAQSLTNVGGDVGWGSSNSVTRHSPRDQLCRNRYCLFQFVTFPSSAKWLWSSHVETFGEYSVLAGSVDRLAFASRRARGRTHSE
jgi:hypothetical protein